MTSVKNIVVIIISAFVATVANAQENIAGLVAGVGNSKGCFHASIEEGVLHIENCNGFYAAPVAGWSQTSYKNNDGNATTSALKVGAQIGYRHGALRPEISMYYTPSIEIEGKKYNAPEFGAALNVDINRHSVVDFYAAPTIAYKAVNCHKDLTTDKVELHIPYEGNCFMLGGKAGMMIKVGAPAHNKSVVLNGKRIKYVSHSQLYIKVEGYYQTGHVSKPAHDKLTMNEYGVNASLVWKLK